MEQLLQVGVITQTHGVHGEVKVFPTTDDPKRFLDLEYVFLDTGREKKKLFIQSVKFFKQFVILKFKGINNINDIEQYKRCPLLVDRENAVELEEDEYFFQSVNLSAELTSALCIKIFFSQSLKSLADIPPTFLPTSS